MSPDAQGAGMMPSEMQSMVDAILSKVGAPPKTKSPAVPSQPIANRGVPSSLATMSIPDASMMTRESVMEAVMAAVQSALAVSGAPGILDTTVESNMSGARGAESYAREKRKFDMSPDDSYNDGRNKVRHTLGCREGAPTQFARMLNELTFGTFNTKKKSAAIFLAILDAFDLEDVPKARGLAMQALRWLVLDLEAPRDPQMSWRLTFLPDPLSVICPTRASSQLDLNSTILDIGQLTATMGISRDMDLMNKRLKGINPDEERTVHKPKGEGTKGGGRGKGKDKEE